MNNPFEKHNNPKIDPVLAEINLEELTAEHVATGIAGSEKRDAEKIHDFAHEGKMKFVPKSFPGQNNHV